MKIVLPLAGKGTRLLPHTETIPKPLMFVAGKVILDYLIDELISLNPTEFVFIVGYLQDEIKSHITKHYPNITVKFIEQVDPQGLGHAIYQARDAFAKDEEMLVILGDQTFSVDWDQMLVNNSNRIGVVRVSNPQNFGVVEVQDGQIVGMEEKPEQPKSDLAISGLYYFPSAQAVFSTLAHQIAKNIRTRGEIQITDTMSIMMSLGEQFQIQMISDWNDCGNHHDLIRANKTLLEKNPQKPTITQEDVIIHEPVWIHPNAQIHNSTIGPNVSIASDAVITDSTLVDTIVDCYAQIKTSTLTMSYIGKNVHIEQLTASEQFLIS